LKRRGKKAKAAAEHGSPADEGIEDSVAGRVLTLRPQRPKLALAGASLAAATVALVVTLLARRVRD